MYQLRPAPKALGGVLGLIVLAVVLALLPLTWAIAGVTAAILVVTVVISPALGLIVLALAIPFGRALWLSSTSIGLVDALVLLTLAAWLARGLTARHLTLERIPLLWPLAIFLWFGIASLVSAISWRQGVLEWLKWAEFAVLYLVAAQVLRRRHVVWVLIAFFGAAVYEVGLGGLQFTRHVGPEAFEISGQFTRAHGTLQQPNPYAGYLGYLMPVALSLAIGALAGWWTSRKTTSLLIGLLALAVALALLAGIGMSWSRGAWLSAATAILVVIAFRSRRAMLILGSILLALFIIGLLLGPASLPASISARITDLSSYVIGPDPAATEITDQNFSVLERLAHWQAGIRMFNGAPWLGIGIGNYGVVYPSFALPHWYDPLGHAHNLYINFLAETGILGTVAFLAFWASVTMLAYRTARNPDPFVRSLALGLLGTVAYLTMHNLFDNLFVQHLQLQLALLLGAVVALGIQSPSRAR